MELVTADREGPLHGLGDAVLWPRCLAGDAEAFGVIFDRHRDRVFGAATRLAEGRHEAEDVTASAFLELWRRREGVRVVDGSVLPWLLVTTTNLGRNAARSRRRYRDFLSRLPAGEHAPDVAEIVMDTHAMGVDPRLRAGLRGLRTVDAQLIALIALEGCRVETAAELLGLSESSARSRLHRARQTLRKQFGSAPSDGVTIGGE